MFKSGKEMVITGNVKIMKRNSSLERQIHSKGTKPITYKAMRRITKGVKSPITTIRDFKTEV